METKLTVTDSPHSGGLLLSMRFPQELVDTIIDEIAGLVTRPQNARSGLRACSLTARSFLPRSQLQLFADISCHRSGSSSDLMKFDRLLAEFPHIGELLRYLTLQLESYASSYVHEKTVVVPRMLRLLPGLTHLLLDLDCDYGHSWALQPDLLKTSLHAAFSLHCLRSLCLAGLNFSDVSELELLLSHAIGLKALILDRVSFDDSFVVRRVDFLCEPHPIILESPTLDSFDAVDAMVSSFRIVDIQHL
ncbi:hypothetical protein C8J57DRAFT_1497246 [Mycena rebaudengoi]|nr:hypothetical protein C8J57DRAFT_1497246 [Mycena rebaudengoi]